MHIVFICEGRVTLVGNSSLPNLNGHCFRSLRVRCYHIVSLRERVELQPLGKSPVRAELLSMERLLVEGISVLKKYSISMSLLLIHKKRGRITDITTVVFICERGSYGKINR